MVLPQFNIFNISDQTSTQKIRRNEGPSLNYVRHLSGIFNPPSPCNAFVTQIPTLQHVKTK